MERDGHMKPISPNTTALVRPDGKVLYRAYSEPRFYQRAGEWRTIDYKALSDVSVGATPFKRRSHGPRTIDIKKDGGNSGCVVIRNTDGPEKLSIGLTSIKKNGVVVGDDITAPKKKDNNTQDMGAMLVRSTGYRTRLFVPATEKVTSIAVTFDIQASGLKVKEDAGQYWFVDQKGRVFAGLSRPVLADAKTYEVVDGSQEVLGHTLTQVRPGRWTYTKFSLPKFAAFKKPESYLVDADIVYSNTSDGYIRGSNAVWATARSGTGDEVDASSAQTKWAIGCQEGAGKYYIYRTVFFFDLSALSGVVSSAVIYVRGYNSGGQTVIAQGSSATAPLGNSDFSTYSGLDDGEWARVVTWAANASNAFTLNAAGIAGVQTALGGTLPAMLRDIRDYANTVIGAGEIYTSGVVYAEHVDPAQRPYIEIEVAPASSGYPWSSHPWDGTAAWGDEDWGTGKWS